MRLFKNDTQEFDEIFLVYYVINSMYWLRGSLNSSKTALVRIRSSENSFRRNFRKFTFRNTNFLLKNFSILKIYICLICKKISRIKNVLI